MQTERWRTLSSGLRGLWGTGGRPRIHLMGDHSSLHAGCAAVVDYLKAEIAPFGVLTTNKKEYDLLIVNGEGSMHHANKGYRNKMLALAEAVEKGKPAYLVNTVWQENDHEFDDVLRQLSGITVREIMSHDDLLQNHGIASQVHLDCSFSAPVDENAPFTDHQGAVVIGDFYSQEFKNFVKWTGGPPSRRYPFVSMSDVSWSSLIRELRSASIFLTGRHHGVFAACRARTPFITLPGNTYKIAGVLKMAGLPIPMCQSPLEVFDQIEWVNQNRPLYDALFDWMEQQPPLRLAGLLPA